jgi:hypothetical protein
MRGGCPRPRPPRRPASLQPTCPQPLSLLHQPKQALPADNRACSHTAVQRRTHHDKPTEPVWSHLKRSLANLAKRNLAQLTALIKTRLRRIQYRPGLLDGFHVGTGLDLAPFCNPR